MLGAGIEEVARARSQEVCKPGQECELPRGSKGSH